jgi:hypothetical protein
MSWELIDGKKTKIDIRRPVIHLNEREYRREFLPDLGGTPQL